MGKPKISPPIFPFFIFDFQKFENSNKTYCVSHASFIFDSYAPQNSIFFIIDGLIHAVIGDTDELVFILDRAQSMKNVISTIFNNAQHGACAWHVAQNVKNKFKYENIMGSYWMTVNANRVE